MYTQIEVWDEPIKKLMETETITCEMSKQDHAFLCGIIKRTKPRKVLEIGVAEGGTTAVIMKCMSMLGLESEVWSVDLNETLYCDNTQKTGYEYIRLKNMLGGKHKFLLGKTIAGQIDNIGKDIDLVILDTTHEMPGEILDFLCVFPYLSSSATIVLHDVNLNYGKAVLDDFNRIASSKDAIATKVLLSTVVADKYMVVDRQFPNIAAFSINNDTGKYIDDLFYVLTMNWSYMPTEIILDEYRAQFERHYSRESLEWFDLATGNNRKIHERYSLMKGVYNDGIPRYFFPYDQIPKGSRIVIYGAGKVGKEVYFYQSKGNIYDIVAWVDKNSEEYRKQGMDVKDPIVLEKYEFDYIVVAVERDMVFSEIRDEILINNWAKVENIVGPMKKY